MSILERTRSLVVLNNDKAILELSLDLRELTKEQQRARFFGSHETGWFYLHSNDAKRRNMVFECIVGQGGETVSTLYMGHPIFESLSELQKTRRELMEAIGAQVGLDFRSVGVDDPSRGREIGLEEMSTAQLADMLEERIRGVALVKAEHDSYGLDHINKIGVTATPDKVLVREKLENAAVLTMQADGTIKAVPLDD